MNLYAIRNKKRRTISRVILAKGFSLLGVDMTAELRHGSHGAATLAVDNLLIFANNYYKHKAYDKYAVD